MWGSMTLRRNDCTQFILYRHHSDAWFFHPNGCEPHLWTLRTNSSPNDISVCTFFLLLPRPHYLFVFISFESCKGMLEFVPKLEKEAQLYWVAFKCPMCNFFKSISCFHSLASYDFLESKRIEESLDHMCWVRHGLGMGMDFSWLIVLVKIDYLILESNRCNIMFLIFSPVICFHYYCWCCSIISTLLSFMFL